MTDDKLLSGQQPAAQAQQNNETFKGNTDLVTRDPQALEHTLQDPAYPGAAPAVLVDPPLLTVGVNTQGLATSAAIIDPLLARDIDPNPDYIPPDQKAPVHPVENPNETHPKTLIDPLTGNVK